MSKDNLSLIQMVGLVMTGLISLGFILGWKFDAAMSCTAAEIKKETAEIYVNKEVFISEMKGLNYKIDAIGRAVGARTR